MFAAGAGVIGQYEQCSYRLAGTGTFFGTDATNPTVGAEGPPRGGQRVAAGGGRARGEGRCGGRGDAAAHSYEEPAFDVYPLRPAAGAAGKGGSATWRTRFPSVSLPGEPRRRLRAVAVQFVGDPERLVRRVAVACGAAGEFLMESVRANADVFLTGEVRFHDALAAQAAGVGLILPGHYATERPAVEELAARLAGEFPGATVWASRAERDPLALIVS